MESLKTQLEGPAYNRWVRAGLVLRQLNRGLRLFLTTEVQSIQKTIISTVSATLPPGRAVPSSCSCTAEDRKKKRPCPSGICPVFQKEIEVIHRFGKANLNNTKVEKWLDPTQSWEVAKCFMSEGYRDKMSASETDCAGQLGLLLTCTSFHSKLKDAATPNSVFSQVRELRNKVMHSSDLTLKESQLDQIVKGSTAILNEVIALGPDPACSAAVNTITEIASNTLLLSDVDHLSLLRDLREGQLEGLRRDVETKLQTLQHTLEVKLEQGSQHTDAETKKLCLAIDRLRREKVELNDRISLERVHTDTEVGQLHSRIQRLENRLEIEKTHDDKTSSNKDLENQLQEVKLMIHQKVFALQQDLMKISPKLQSLEDRVSVLEELPKVNRELIEELVEDILRTREEDHSETKNDMELDEASLQGYLQVSYHDDTTLKVCITPSARDVTLSRVYTPIVIREDLEVTGQDVDRPTGAVQNHPFSRKSPMLPDRLITSYIEMFYKDEGLHKNLYLLGEAGSGKTTFCDHLVDLWCRSPDTAHYEHAEVITQFEFVFLVSCRDAKATDTVLDMILDQLFDVDTEHESTVRRVLRTKPEKCLVIIDGLDEWAGSPTKSTGPRGICGLPNRKGLEKSVVLTTSRPWRIQALRQGLGKSPRVLEIRSLSGGGMEALSKNMISALDIPNPSDTLISFLDNLKGVKMLDIVQTPLMLIIVLTVWLSNRTLDRSLCINFSRMIEFLIQRAEGQSRRTGDSDRLADITDLQSVKSEWARLDMSLPSCFNQMRFCKRFAPLIFKLAEFAFLGLFPKGEEMTLVFSMEELEQCFTQLELEVCLKIGIFSVKPGPVRSSQRMASVTFLHRSLQEYLAALWMVSGDFKDRLTVVKDHFRSLRCVLDFGEFIVFVCGISPAKGRELWDFIGEVTGPDPVLQEYRRAVVGSGISARHGHLTPVVIRLLQLVLECLSEIQFSQPGQPDSPTLRYVIHDVYVDERFTTEQFDQLCRQVINSPLEIKSLVVSNTVSDTCLLQAALSMSQLERLHLHPVSPQSQQLCNRIITAVNRFRNLRSLFVSNVPVSAPDHVAVHLPPDLTSLTLDMMSIGHSVRLLLPSRLAELHIISVTLSHQGIVDLTSWLQDSVSLTVYYMRYVKCNDCGGNCRYDLDLSQNKHLEKLMLGDWHQGVQSVLVSPEMSRLTSVSLYCVHMSSEVWSNLVRNLPKTSHQLTGALWLVDIDTDTVQYISENFTVKSVTTDKSGLTVLDFHT